MMIMVQQYTRTQTQHYIYILTHTQKQTNKNKHDMIWFDFMSIRITLQTRFYDKKRHVENSY